MTALRLVPVVLVALLLQLTLFVDVRIAGVAPEMLALVAMLAGLLAGAHRGSLIAFVVGLVWDVYLSTPIGLAAASFSLVAYAVGGVTEDLFHETRIQTVAVVFLGTAASVMVYALLGGLIGQHGLIDDDLVGVVLLSSAMNAALALPTARAVRWALASGGQKTRLRSVPAGSGVR